MKYTIEVDDFYLEEDELSEALLSHIKYAVIQKISKNIEGKVQKEITDKVALTIEEKLSPVIDLAIANIVDSGILIKQGKEISIVDYIKEKFHNAGNWNSVNTHITRTSENFVSQIKKQYDSAFANNIVLGMKKQGLLKDNVVDLLLGKD